MADQVFLVNDREVVLTTSLHVRCDGGGPLGHPREFMTLEHAEEVVCKYCGRRFVRADSAAAETVRRQGQALAPAEASGRGR
jgi:uncharacterized Zn-finger protein